MKVSSNSAKQDWYICFAWPWMTDSVGWKINKCIMHFFSLSVFNHSSVNSRLLPFTVIKTSKKLNVLIKMLDFCI